MRIGKIARRRAIRKEKHRSDKQKRIEALQKLDPESLEYRKAYWGTYCKIYVSPNDQKDIDAGDAMMRKTARTTIDEQAVPWHIGKPQHRSFYHDKKLVTNQLTD